MGLSGGILWGWTGVFRCWHRCVVTIVCHRARLTSFSRFAKGLRPAERARTRAAGLPAPGSGLSDTFPNSNRTVITTLPHPRIPRTCLVCLSVCRALGNGLLTVHPCVAGEFPRFRLTFCLGSRPLVGCPLDASPGPPTILPQISQHSSDTGYMIPFFEGDYLKKCQGISKLLINNSSRKN